MFVKGKLCGLPFFFGKSFTLNRNTMKKLLFFLALPFLFAVQAQAQKFGFIDSNLILDKMPEYKQAQEQLNQMSAKWQSEVEALKAKHEQLKQDYLAEEILLTPEMRKEKTANIEKAFADMKDLQNRYFGFEGMLFLKRQELVQNIQAQIAKACEKVCKKKRLAFLFDRSGEMVMIYANPVHDYTDYVLEELGMGDPNDTLDK